VLVGVLGNRTRTAGVEQKMFWQVSRHLNPRITYDHCL
jgi:hypothetical protein